MNYIRYKLHIPEPSIISKAWSVSYSVSSLTLEQHLSTLCAIKDSHCILDSSGAGCQRCDKFVFGMEVELWNGVRMSVFYMLSNLQK